MKAHDRSQKLPLAAQDVGELSGLRLCRIFGCLKKDQKKLSKNPFDSGFNFSYTSERKNDIFSAQGLYFSPISVLPDEGGNPSRERNRANLRYAGFRGKKNLWKEDVKSAVSFPLQVEGKNVNFFPRRGLLFPRFLSYQVKGNHSRSISLRRTCASGFRGNEKNRCPAKNFLNRVNFSPFCEETDRGPFQMAP